ncbi:hypothetical protein LCGC14_0752080, partial [marine sediment metagenome]
MRRFLLGLAVGLAVAATSMTPAFADEFTVADIEVEGLQRVSAGTVFSAFPINIGEQMDETELAESIKSLFRTGLFTDIEASRDAGILILTVRERPSITSIDIEGNKNIETGMLKDALAGAGLQEGQVFRRATLERLELEILRSYIGQGRYNARVKATAEVLPRNRVAIRLDINEGTVAAIRHINLVGNHDFSDEQLRDLFELKTSSWWNSLTNSDKYARERLSGDLETLRSFYLDQGYLDFNVESSQVSISPDKRQVFIAIALNEGQQYTISDIRLRGDLIIDEKELRELIPLEEGDVFSRARMISISETLAFRLGKEGYASVTHKEGGWNGRIYHLFNNRLDKPLHWKKARKIFLCSMGDLFHESVPFEFICKIMTIIGKTRHHTYQILTKRPERVVELCRWILGGTEQISIAPWLPNIWLGVTAENQEMADKRIPTLLQIPAAV